MPINDLQDQDKVISLAWSYLGENSKTSRQQALIDKEKLKSKSDHASIQNDKIISQNKWI